MLGGYTIRAEGTSARVKLRGIDNGGWGQVLAESDEFMVVKWPGHKYWSGRGMQSYSPPIVTVYRKTIKTPVLGDPEPAEWIEPLVSYSAGRKKERGGVA